MAVQPFTENWEYRSLYEDIMPVSWKIALTMAVSDIV